MDLGEPSRQLEELEERLSRASSSALAAVRRSGGGEPENAALLAHAVRSALVVDDRGIIRCHAGRATEQLDLEEDCIGSTIAVVSPRLGFSIELDVQSVIESRAPLDRTVRGPDGRWLRLTFAYCGLQDRGGVVITIRDVTLAHDLESYMAWGAAFVENAAEAMIGVYRDGTVVFWNPAAQRLFGYTAREIDGLPFTTLVPSGNDDEVRILRRAVKKGLTIGPKNMILVGKDGRLLDVVWKLIPILDAAAEVRGGLALCRDKRAVDNTADVAPAAAPPSLDEQVLQKASALSLSNASLQREVMQRERLAARVAQAQDLERRRIGRELHDGIGQYLAALAMNLSRFDVGEGGVGEDQRKLVADTMALLQQCVREVRTMSHLLHPPMLDEMGLVTAIRWYCEGFSRRSGIRVGIHVDDSIDRLAPNVELSLFRVLQEALTNIQRHSGSRVAKIALTRSASMVHLEVSDAGCGIASEVLAKMRSDTGALGVGIVGMRDRLRQLGGRLSVSSAGKGVTVLAIVALELSDWGNR